MAKFYSLLFVLCFTIQSGFAQAPELTMTDINGVEHDIYADYLDQGITVMMVLDAAWNPWAEVFVESGVLQDFHTQFAGTDAVILWVDVDPTTTLADLQGSGNQGTGYDYIADNPYPIFNPENFDLEGWELQYYPTIRLLCPDGGAYADGVSGAPDTSDTFILTDEIFYGEFETADNIAEAMISLCGTQFDISSLSAQVYSDDDDNCEYASTENGIPGIHAVITGPNGDFNRVSNSNGTFGALLAEGEYTVHIEEPNDLWTVCNNDQTINITDTNTNASLDFGLQSDQDCINPVIDLSVPVLRRCFESWMFIDFCNEGTVVMEDATVDLFLNDAISIVESSIPVSVQNGNQYTFDVGDLDPWECGEINIVIFTDCEVELGDELCYQAEILPSADCVVDPRSLGLECQEVVGSFDPNDKRAFPLNGTDQYKVFPNTEIKYQIRFQNTGTDTAFNVFIDDQISDLMDLTSLRGGASSHAYEIEILDERIVKFKFDNIMLPDSNVNLLGSNGFVNYYLTQNPGHVNGTIIENYADIFFDFNDPVRTNTTYHEVDDGTTHTNDLSAAIDFGLSPNPTKDNIILTTKDDIGPNAQVSIVDLQGKVLHVQRLQENKQEIDLSSISAGIYLMYVKAEDGSIGTRKFIVLD